MWDLIDIRVIVACWIISCVRNNNVIKNNMDEGDFGGAKALNEIQFKF